MTSEDKVIERLKKDINKPLACGDITIVNIDDLKTVLNLLEEKDKIIDLMSLAISNYDAQLIINKYKNKEDVKIHFIENCEEYCKQYFENKVGKDKI